MPFDANGVWSQGEGMQPQGGAVPGQEAPIGDTRGGTPSPFGITGTSMNMNTGIPGAQGPAASANPALGSPIPIAGGSRGSGWTSPSYDWRFGEGVRAVNQSGAVKGNLLSGGTLFDLMNMGEGMASQEWDQDWQRGYQDRALDFNMMDSNRKFQFGSLYDLANMGLGATDRYAGIYGDMTTGAANAGASGSIANGNAWSNIANTAGQLGTSIWANRRQTPPVPTYTPPMRNNIPNTGSVNLGGYQPPPG